MSLRLDWCSHKAAKYAVEHWHYSGSLPTPPHNRVGVWENDRFIGCVIFSRGATQNIGKPFGLAQTAVAELTRVALTKHEAPVSRILSIAIRFLRQRSSGLRLIVSYADPEEGHVGGIYQATNWLYMGQGTITTEYRDTAGRRWHARMVSPTGKKKVYGKYRRVPKPSELTPVRRIGKHKYVMPLDKAMKKKLEPLAKPYPKKTCAGSVAGDASANHAEEGGSIPTPAL